MITLNIFFSKFKHLNKIESIYINNVMTFVFINSLILNRTMNHSD